MDTLLYHDSLQIRYTKIIFTVAFTEDCVLPRYKASAIRGGMGEMLLRANCIANRECDSCSFRSECLVQRILYSPMAICPPFMSGKDGIGYVIECENYEEFANAGDQMQFRILLFGNSIVYFSSILNALYALGMNGLGKDCARFEITRIENLYKEPILQNGNILMENYRFQFLSDQVTYRKKQLQKNNFRGTISFQTPLTLKYQNEIQHRFQPNTLFSGIRRRLYILNCFEGFETDLTETNDQTPSVISLSESHKEVSVRRYSTHQKNAMYLRGIEGSLQLDPSSVSEENLELLLAGELIHIGKNTSFGFGRYYVK